MFGKFGNFFGDLLVKIFWILTKIENLKFANENFQFFN